MSHRRVLAAAGRPRIPLAPPPPTTVLGALVAHVTGCADSSLFQPMNVDFGLFRRSTPPGDGAGGASGTRGYTDRGNVDFAAWSEPAHVEA